MTPYFKMIHKVNMIYDLYSYKINKLIGSFYSLDIFRFIMFSSLVILVSDVFGQGGMENLNSYSPPSQESQSVIQNMNDSNVDLYSGRMTYEASLDNLSLGGLNLPVSLHYSTRGFKVQDLASSVGLGWSFSLLSVVTRSIEGLPDDDYNGYCGAGNVGSSVSQNLSTDYLKKLVSNEWDSQPDKFFFSFHGYSGSFVLDKDGFPVLLSESSGLKIINSPLSRNGINKKEWIFKDQLNNTFVFGGEAIEISSFTHKNKNSSRNISAETSWFLKTIILNNQDEINFTYQEGLSVTYTNYVNTRMNMIVAGACSSSYPSESFWQEDVDITISRPIYLEKISYDKTLISFNYHSREDLLNSQALSRMIINYNGNRIKEFDLIYSYFISDDGTSTKRLKLENIIQRGRQEEIPIYKFYYNESVNLPSRASVKTDYAGFYNNNNSSSNIIDYTNSDLEPYLINAKANVMTMVKGLTENISFEYELNSFNLGGVNHTAAGLRVKKLLKTSNEVITSYDYSYVNPNFQSSSSGEIFRELRNKKTILNYFIIVPGYFCGLSFQLSYSTNLNFINDFSDVDLGYTFVTLKSGDNGKVTYKFSNYSDYPDQYSKSTYSNNIEGSYLGGDLATYFPYTNFRFARGKILYEEYFDNNGIIKKRKEYNYQLNTARNTVNCLKAFISNYVNGNPSSFYIGRYNFFSQDLQLVSFKEIEYIEGNAGPVIEEYYEYSNYARNLLTLRRIKRNNERMDYYKYRYVFDVISAIPSSNPSINFLYSYMVYNNIIGTSLEQIHYFEQNGATKIVDINVNKFIAQNNGIVLSKTYFLPQNYSKSYPSDYNNFNVNVTSSSENELIDSELTLSHQYFYDNKLNVIEEHNLIKGIVLSNLIGYNRLKVASVLNSNKEDIAYTSFEDDFKGNWSYTGNSKVSTNIYPRTGIYFYDLAEGSLIKNGLNPSFQYILSYWTTNTTPYTVLGTLGIPKNICEQGLWRNYEHLVNDISSVEIVGTGNIDEVRLFPVLSQMKSFTYLPYIGITCETDASGKTIFYEYDNFHRLKTIRDSELNIIKSINYNYRSIAP